MQDLIRQSVSFVVATALHSCPEQYCSLQMVHHFKALTGEDTKRAEPTGLLNAITDVRFDNVHVRRDFAWANEGPDTSNNI